VKLADVVPVATVTAAGTVAAVVLLLDTVTVRWATVPVAGAFSATVPIEFVAPPGTLVGFSVKDATTGKCTVRTKFWTAFGPTPLLAVKVTVYVPAVPDAGVPLNVPVDALNVTPPGSAPLSLSVGAGSPVAVTLNEPARPTVNAMVLALVIAGD
jgi:hypothetical protein